MKLDTKYMLKMVVIVHIFIPRFLDFIAGPFIGIEKTGCRPGSKNIKSFILNFEETLK